MIRIKLLSIGKTKESWLEEAAQEYVKRLSNQVTFEFSWVKDNEQLIAHAAKDSHVLCLDPAGTAFSSEEFSPFLMQQIQKGNSRLTIIIGGAEGLPHEMKSHYPLISLSKMTFTHQITRLILMEQIYRSFEIGKGSQYHK